MTNQQLCEFLTARAAARGKEHGLRNPSLVIYKNTSNLYLAFKFEGIDTPFLLMFTQGPMRAVFRLTTTNADALAQLKSSVFSKLAQTGAADVAYSEVDIPMPVKNKISATLVQTFKTADMGMCVVNSSYGYFSIVDANETYEEIAIENDLNAFLSCDLAAL